MNFQKSFFVQPVFFPIMCVNDRVYMYVSMGIREKKIIKMNLQCGLGIWWNKKKHGLNLPQPIVRVITLLTGEMA